ncbi:MAG TPA: type II toxin-antitoxin system VapC family toxin [Terracidiphilus sp.]|nr:type II toxin-antitoxin system VapC family toxin [Terracidiphilus sp.]
MDTQIAIWALLDDVRLGEPAREALGDLTNECIFSVSSIWEIAIKRALKKPGFLHDPREIRRQLLANGYEELTIQSQHAVTVDSIPLIHRDPFDRILIAQAMVEGITLLTADPRIAQYPGPIWKV